MLNEKRRKMKKIFVVIAILGISLWGVSELNAALSQHITTAEADKCAKGTEECDDKEGKYELWCKDGGPGDSCDAPCPYMINDDECNEEEPIGI